MPNKLNEIVGEMRTARNRIGVLLEKKTDDGRLDWTAAERDEAQALNKQCDDLQPKLDELLEEGRLEEKNRKSLDDLNRVFVPGTFSGAPSSGRGRRVSGGFLGDDGASLMEKSAGHLFVEHKGYKAARGGKANGSTVVMPDFEVKTLFQTSAGFDPFVPRMPNIVLSAQQQPRVVDLLPTSETTNHSIKWMLETTYTNAADATAEGGTYPEAALAFTEQLSPVQKIAVFMPVTDEQFDDEPRMRDMVNNRLGLMLRQKFDQELVSGTGTTPHLTGYLTVSGIQTQAKAADPGPSAIFKAMTKIQNVAFANPSGVIMNPTDWQNIKLLQTADGLYIWGHPSASTPNTIWGLPVVTTTYQTLGTAGVGDFAGYTEVIYRKGVEFQTSNSHSDYFSKGQLAVRAQLRVAFIVTRPAAICKVTGL